jgi:hypothetical protein
LLADNGAVKTESDEELLLADHRGIIDGQYTHLRRITCDHGKWRGRRCWIEAHSGLCKKIRDVDTGEEHNFPLAIRLRAAGKGRAKMLRADGLTCWPRTISARVYRAWIRRSPIPTEKGRESRSGNQ